MVQTQTMKNEVATIQRIRDANPKVPAKTLARRIESGEFPGTSVSDDFYRTFLSTYSVIRRYDEKKGRNNVPTGSSAMAKRVRKIHQGI